jgi:hypothetical protein
MPDLKQDTMMAYEEMELEFHISLTTSLAGVNWSPYLSGRLSCEYRTDYGLQTRSGCFGEEAETINNFNE